MKYSIYQPGIIMDKTDETKFNILFDNQQDILCVPRQSIRLFLPPWHDGLLKTNVLFNLFFFSNRNSY